jgi:hypothetical protein
MRWKDLPPDEWLRLGFVANLLIKSTCGMDNQRF